MTPYVNVSSAQVEALVAQTFAAEDANRDGVIDFAEYSSMIGRAPGTMKVLTLTSISDLISSGGAL